MLYMVKSAMAKVRKITVLLPANLIADAQKATGEGVTETLRQALKGIVHSSWSRRLLALEGRAPLKLDVDELREDEASSSQRSSRNAAA